MELLDRYLNAVKGYLPEAQQNDIIEELKDSLMSQIEEREAALKRPLTDAELQAFIKQSAHPMLVAGRYLPQQYLIGPEMYPFWWASQRVMLMVTASIYSLLAGIQIVTSGDNFIQSLIQTLFQAFAGFVGTALFYAAVITLVFWLFERNQVRFGFMDRWNPEKLAPVKETLQIKRGDSIFDLVTETLFLLWWVGAISFATTFYHHGKPVPFAMSPVWDSYWWGILFIAAGSIAISAFNLIAPYWTQRRLLVRISLNLVVIGIAYALFQHDALIVVGDGDKILGNYGSTAALLNNSAHGILVVVALISLGEIAVDARRLVTR